VRPAPESVREISYSADGFSMADQMLSASSYIAADGGTQEAVQRKRGGSG
jgi:hypothetical protein